MVKLITFLATLIGRTPSVTTGNSLWIRGVRVNRYQGSILWMYGLNWLLVVLMFFIWTGLLYSCCMSSMKQGPVRFAVDEVHLTLDTECGDETSNAEAIAQELQA
ncbi:hypothetical protein P153DRAFT_402884 [Dothidotthia symphoricarpi CBS 119687]|uniref:Uncharacterized protein n=1 Tax=Dothidotthia symphoricarpi CBS 119687 TaxID=1392245 RepID=A0A6A6AWY3_9PLEO|nr:uncharacterized protein P153DRAFT_402884 [Dothidotthia symphoricarpi CBS 119687]KAF2135051.1 hypothetical protein P153DRAFT_402884 [Dothidotthia symphoricarpi CBS 119687]